MLRSESLEMQHWNQVLQADIRVHPDVSLQQCCIHIFEPHRGNHSCCRKQGTDELSTGLKEYSHMLRFKHSQCIVRVESFIHNTAKQCAHFLMELCLGNAVYEERVLIPSFSEPVAAKVALQLGQGLLIIHKKDSVHRDLKGGNVFKTFKNINQADFKIGDFGFCEKVSDLTQDPAAKPMYTMGTREYMAPEAWQGIIAPSGDIHCLGVMLYKMLTGRYPYLYEGSDPQGDFLYKLIQNSQLDFTHEIWHGVSIEARLFVKSLLEKDTKDRPSAAQIVTDPWVKTVAFTKKMGNSRKRKHAPRSNPDEFDMTALKPKKMCTLQTA